MTNSIQLPHATEDAKLTDVVASEKKYELQKNRLASKEKKLETRQKNLSKMADEIEREKQQLVDQKAEIALNRRVGKLIPRQVAVEKQLEALTEKKEDVKKRIGELGSRLKDIKKEKKSPTPDERNIAKLRSELSDEMKDVRKREAELLRQGRDLDFKMQPATLVAQSNAEKRRKAKENPRHALMKKKFGGVHPSAISDYLPELPPVLHATSEQAYGVLTDESTFSEYAWAFLRRNRFYQRLIDRAVPNITEANWEYANDRGNQPPIGLMNLKHYKEAFASGVPVEWWGIHSFREQLRPIVASALDRNMKRVELEWSLTQVSLTFDIGPMLGQTTAALDPQICIARAYLQSLAKKKEVLFPKKLKPPDKSLFRAQLRVADQLSAPQFPPDVIDSNGELKKGKKKIRTWLTISQVADLLPAYDLKRKRSNGATTKVQKVNRASELAKGAWDNIYNWKFLQALQFDDWQHLGVPKKKPVATSKKYSQIETKSNPEKR